MLKNLIRPPFAYIGAKTKLLQWIYQFFPDHVTFVDVFGGTGVVTFNKIPSKNDVYNDINGRIVNFYSVLRDEYSRQILQDLIALTPYSRKEFQNCKNPSEDPIEDARRFYVRQNQSFSGVGRTFGYNRNSKNTLISRFYNLSGGVFDRLKDITFECLPFERIFKNYDSDETLFYCDPPYIGTYGTDEYSCSFDIEEQNKLIACLKNVKGYVVLSSYQHESLSELLDAGWKIETKDFKCTLKNSEQGRNLDHKRTESIYLNPKLKNKIRDRLL